MAGTVKYQVSLEAEQWALQWIQSWQHGLQLWLLQAVWLEASPQHPWTFTSSSENGIKQRLPQTIAARTLSFMGARNKPSVFSDPVAILSCSPAARPLPGTSCHIPSSCTFRVPGMALPCLAVLRTVTPHLQLGREADTQIIVFMWLLLLSIWVRELMQDGMLKTKQKTP